MQDDTDKTWMEVHGGFARDMTLRDHYAGLAMQVLKESFWDFELLSEEAYELADAMLKARDAS